MFLLIRGYGSVAVPLMILFKLQSGEHTPTTHPCSGLVVVVQGPKVISPRVQRGRGGDWDGWTAPPRAGGSVVEASFS